MGKNCYNFSYSSSSLHICCQVLETIPWDKLDIEVIMVETNHLGEVFPFFFIFFILTYLCLLLLFFFFLSFFSMIYLAKVFPGSRQKLHKFFNNHDYVYVATLCRTQYPVLDVEITIDIFRCGRCLCAKGPTQQVQS